MEEKQKFVTIGSKWLNRYTNATYTVLSMKGLKVTTQREDTLEICEQHYSNMKSCFTKIS